MHLGGGNIQYAGYDKVGKSQFWAPRADSNLTPSDSGEMGVCSYIPRDLCNGYRGG